MKYLAVISYIGNAGNHSVSPITLASISAAEALASEIRSRGYGWQCIVVKQGISFEEILMELVKSDPLADVDVLVEKAKKLQVILNQE